MIKTIKPDPAKSEVLQKKKKKRTIRAIHLLKNSLELLGLYMLFFL